MDKRSRHRGAAVWTGLLIAALTWTGAAAPAVAAPPGAVFVAATWDDQSIHFLDANLNDLGSFPAGASNPNGLATDAMRIYSGHFTTQQVFAYDLNGNILFNWSGAFPNLQGLEIVNGELAIANDDLILFYDPTTGAFIRDIPSQGMTVEGLAFDGTFLWQLADSLIATDPSNGAVVRSIPNAAINCDFEGGTGVSVVPGGFGQLVLACPGGEWFRVSSADGSVLQSGNNGLDMFGLSELRAPAAAVPSLSQSAFLLLIALLAVAGALQISSAARRRLS